MNFTANLNENVIVDNNQFFNALLHLTGVGIDDELTSQIFKLGGQPDITKSLVRGWRAERGTKRGTNMHDTKLEAFIQGMFLYRDLMRAQGVEVFNFPVKPKQKQEQEQ